VAGLRSSAGWLAALLAVSYPLAVYFGLQHGHLRLVGLALLAAVVLRLISSRSRSALVTVSAVLGAILAVAIYLTRSELLARLYPVLVNLTLLAAFGLSLVWPPAIVTRIAQAAGTRLDARGIAYTRKVTIYWCGFFFVNGGISLYTTLYSAQQTWLLYNGLIAYLLGALLFGVEFLLRPVQPSASDAR
jgi:uncharacterized membrane protein